MVRNSRRIALSLLTVVVAAAAAPAHAAPVARALRNRGSSESAAQMLPVFQRVRYDLIESPIPVFLPRWLPSESLKGYATFSHSKTGYTVTVYIDAKHRGDVQEVVWVSGEYGEGAVQSNTRPVSLPGGHWAYVNPNTGGNVGPTVEIVRAVLGTTTTEDFTYNVGATCGVSHRTLQQQNACFARVIGSLGRVVVPLAALKQH